MAAVENVVAQLHVPTVTEYNLQAFHTRHFSSSHGAPFTVFNDEHDDGLGYYPDGVKRTLTDDQIAMFRHSEIQTLIRQQRRREEAEEDEGEGGDVFRHNIQQAPRPIQNPSNHEPHPPLSGRVEKKKKKAKKTKQSSQGDNNGKNYNINNNAWTHRRVAREQDDVKQADLELDYGD